MKAAGKPAYWDSEFVSGEAGDEPATGRRRDVRDGFVRFGRAGLAAVRRDYATGGPDRLSARVFGVSADIQSTIVPGYLPECTVRTVTTRVFGESKISHTSLERSKRH